MAENEGRAALSAGKGAAHKLLDLFTKYLLPIAAFFVGVFSGVQTWGGINAVASGLAKAGSATGPLQQNVRWIGAGLFGGIFGLTGYAFWGLDGGTIMNVVGRGFGGYFFGVAVSYLVTAIGTDATPDGLIDDLVAGLQGI